MNESGPESRKNFDFFCNQSFLTNPRSKNTSGYSDLDLDAPLRLDFSSNSSKSSEKFRPLSVDSFKKPEKFFNQLDFSIDLKKFKENPKNNEVDLNHLQKGMETEAVKAEKFFNVKYSENKAEKNANPTTEKPISSINQKKNNENSVNKPEIPQKNLNFKKDEDNSKAPASESVKIDQNSFKSIPKHSEKKIEPEIVKNSDRSNKFGLKKSFENPLKRKNNTLSPVANTKMNLFSSAKKSVRITPAVKCNGLAKEDLDFVEMMKRVGELRKSIESIPKLEFEDVISNEKDILNAEKMLPIAILRLLKLKNKQLECMNKIFMSPITEIKDIISKYCELFS